MYSVLNKIANFKRESFPSRNPKERKNENRIRNANRLNLKTIAEATTDYRRSILFANYKLCIVCKSNVVSADQLKDDDELYSVVVEQMPELRRMGFFWKCSNCRGVSSQVERDLEEIKLISVSHFLKEDSFIIFPEKIEGKFIFKESQEFHTCSTDKKIKMFFPEKVNCLDSLENEAVSSIPQISKYFNKLEEVSMKDLSAIYTNQLSKFQKKASYSEVFTANICTNDKNKIQNLEPINDSFKIRGSDSWTINRE